MSTLTLYNFDLSVCSMKTRLALEEKGLPWENRQVNILAAHEQLEPWYIKLNGRAVVPTLVDGEEIVTDSARIIRHIASLGGGNELIPESEDDQAKVDEWIDKANALDLQVLSYRYHPSFEKSEMLLNARIALAFQRKYENPELADRYEEAAKRVLGYKTGRVNDAKIQEIESLADEHIEELEEALQGSSFIVDDDRYTLADVIWTVVLARMELLGLDSKLGADTRPNVAAYYERMKERPSFRAAKVQNEWWENK